MTTSYQICIFLKIEEEITAFPAVDKAVFRQAVAHQIPQTV